MHKNTSKKNDHKEALRVVATSRRIVSSIFPGAIFPRPLWRNVRGWCWLSENWKRMRRALARKIMNALGLPPFTRRPAHLSARQLACVPTLQRVTRQHHQRYIAKPAGLASFFFFLFLLPLFCIHMQTTMCIHGPGQLHCCGVRLLFPFAMSCSFL